MARRRASRIWTEFARRNRRNAFLRSDVLYSLNPELIVAIETEIPGFFGEDNLSFEMDLASTVSLGFFIQREYGDHSFDHSRQQERSQEIDELMMGIMQKDGRKDYQIREYQQSHQAYRDLIENKKNAYRGWLLLQPTYQRELSELKSRWQHHVNDVGRFPIYPRFPNIQVVCDPKFQTELFAFYRRWGLDRLITWCWPVPMEPDLNTQILSGDQNLCETGITLFIPWYLIRGEAMDLQEFIRGSRLYHCEDHLRGWLEPQPGNQRSAISDIRFRNISWLYRYYFLALSTRYSDRLHRHAGKLDNVFGNAYRDGFGNTHRLSSESIKRLRQEIQRCLQCQ